MVDTWAISMLTRVSHLDRDVIWCNTSRPWLCISVLGLGQFWTLLLSGQRSCYWLSVWRRVSSCCCWQRPGASGANYKSTKILWHLCLLRCTQHSKARKTPRRKNNTCLFVTSCGNFIYIYINKIYNVHALLHTSGCTMRYHDRPLAFLPQRLVCPWQPGCQHWLFTAYPLTWWRYVKIHACE